MEHTRLEILESQDDAGAENKNSPNSDTPSYYEIKSGAAANQPFTKQSVSGLEYWGKPADCPLNNHIQVFQAPQAKVISTTTYGGVGSKYKNINEDSYFFGINNQASVITGVIDGAGGSKQGYLASKLSNESLSEQLKNGSDIETAFKVADKNVLENGNGGYATAVALEVYDDKIVLLGAKGDARALTVRDGTILKLGTTRMHSMVARKIELGELPPHAIHTHKKKNVVYSVMGNSLLPFDQTKFQGHTGDIIILASDGLWDIVSDYEIQEMTKRLDAHQLQAAIYLLAFQRNNSHSEFKIQFNRENHLCINPLFPSGQKCRGDNITVQVIELT